jgi:pimeloyl-ACP methyl ester carboxylesterase
MVIMSTFVLLHGAWHGGWCWARVAHRLRRDGHVVLTPTFTGLSDRAPTLSPAVNLSTHVEDVVRLLDADDMNDVVLVGHSYAGAVLSVVAQQRGARLASRIYVDALVPRDGERVLDLFPDSIARDYRDIVARAGAGWLLPPLSPQMLGVKTPEDVAWLERRLTPQPWATYLERVALDGRAERVPGAYIECTKSRGLFRSHRDRARALGWSLHQLATGHEAMVTAPDQLGELLTTIARESAP